MKSFALTLAVLFATLGVAVAAPEVTEEIVATETTTEPAGTTDGSSTEPSQPAAQGQ